MEEKIKKAVEQILNDKNTELCEELIRKEGINSPDFAQAALEAGVFYPNIIYCSASENVRDKLIEMLDEEKAENVDGCLMALAAIGDEVVIKYFKKWDKVLKYFKKWDKSSKRWKNMQYVSPIDYAQEGGWYIDEDKKVKLYFDECYALEEVSEFKPDENIYRMENRERCPKCGFKLHDFIINGRDSRLSFLGINGCISVKTCLTCLPYKEGVYYCKFEEDGYSEFICNVDKKKNCPISKEKDEICRFPPLVISKKRVSKNYCDENMGSAIGGMPCFSYDAIYKSCPKCGKKMKHFMQLGDDYTRHGSIHFQICTDCKITAALSQ